MKTPVLIKSFKRAEATKKVLDRVMEANPELIYITSDGPRLNVENEKEKIFETRDLIDNYNFGHTKVVKKYLDENLGIDRLYELTIWFFDNNETGIILEDDIVPDISFFSFVDELLDYYKNNNKVKFITGSNFVADKYTPDNYSYLFTNIPSFWGWATWSKKIKTIDIDIVKSISEEKYISILKQKFKREKDFSYFKRLFDYQRNGYQIGGDQKFMFNVWEQGGVCIVPSKNLISNIGIDHEFANSKKSNKMSKLSNLETSKITNIIHPKELSTNIKYDNLLMDKIFNPKLTLIDRVCNKIKRTFSRDEV